MTSVSPASGTILYGSATYADGVLSGPSWMDVIFPAILLDPAKAYIVEVDCVANSTSGSNVYLYSCTGPTEVHADASSWFNLGSTTKLPADSPQGTPVTLTVGMGPGIEDWDAAMAAGEKYVIFDMGPNVSVTGIRIEEAEVRTGIIEVSLGPVAAIPRGSTEATDYVASPFVDGPGPLPLGPGNFQLFYQQNQFSSSNNIVQDWSPLDPTLFPAYIDSITVRLEMDIQLDWMVTDFTPNSTNQEIELTWALASGVLGGIQGVNGVNSVGLSEFRTADITKVNTTFSGPMFNLTRVQQYQVVPNSAMRVNLVKYATTTGLRTLMSLLTGPLYPTYGANREWTPWGSGTMTHVSNMRLFLDVGGVYPVTTLPTRIMGRSGDSRRHFT